VIRPEDEHSVVRNAADARQIRAAKKKIKFRRKDELADIRAVLASDPGKRLVWRLLQKTRVFGLSFSAENERLTSFHEGERNIGNWLIHDILEADSLALLEIMKAMTPAEPAAEQEEEQGEEAGDE
jgi:hypothetical protein